MSLKQIFSRSRNSIFGKFKHLRVSNIFVISSHFFVLWWLQVVTPHNQQQNVLNSLITPADYWCSFWDSDLQIKPYILRQFLVCLASQLKLKMRTYLFKRFTIYNFIFTSIILHNALKYSSMQIGIQQRSNKFSNKRLYHLHLFYEYEYKSKPISSNQ